MCYKWNVPRHVGKVGWAMQDAFTMALSRPLVLSLVLNRLLAMARGLDTWISAPCARAKQPYRIGKAFVWPYASTTHTYPHTRAHPSRVHAQALESCSPAFLRVYPLSESRGLLFTINL